MIIERKYKGNSDLNELMLAETLFHNANGYIGVRGSREEGQEDKEKTIRGSYINGVYDIVEMKQAEPLYGLVNEKQGIVNVADVQDVAIYADGCLVKVQSEEIRELDLDNGITKRKFTYKSVNGGSLNVTITRMASFVRLPIFLLKIELASDAKMHIQIKAKQSSAVMNFADPSDPRVASEVVCHIDPLEASIKEHIALLTSKVKKSGIKVSTALLDTLDNTYSHDELDTFSSTLSTFSFTLKKDEKRSFKRIVAFADSRSGDNTVERAKKSLIDAVKAGSEKLFKEQHDYISSFWSNVGFSLEGDEELEKAFRFNVYQLLQSAGKDSISHMAAKGLSGEGYEGHYFWDTEMYVQPLFTLTSPHISKALIEYRYSTLDKARANARLLGHKKGALFPWRTINGSECSGFFPAGTAQYHIDGAVAYSVIMYYQVTGDKEFMTSIGLELLIEIARLWLDCGNYHKGRFEIHCVTGPDEYTCIVNNNYYTNLSARYDLHYAAKYVREFRNNESVKALLKKLSFDLNEAEEFEKAEKAMFIPYDEELDISPQDDSFLSKKVWNIEETPKEMFPLLLHYHPLTLYRYQVCKQADALMGHFLYEDESYSTLLNSFRYYEKVTTHDSSLSRCIFSIMASRLGLKDEAYKYFSTSAQIDLLDTNKNTKDGIHTANMGGSYLCLLFGFAGLRIKEDGFYLQPSLPKEWKKFTFSLTLRGVRLHIIITQNECLITSEDNISFPLYINGDKVSIKAGETIKREVK